MAFTVSVMYDDWCRRGGDWFSRNKAELTGSTERGWVKKSTCRQGRSIVDMMDGMIVEENPNCEDQLSTSGKLKNGGRAQSRSSELEMSSEAVAEKEIELEESTGKMKWEDQI